MFNGLRNTGAVLGANPDESRRAFARHRDNTDRRAAAGEDTAHPDQLGYGMVLEARGNVYDGTVGAAVKARRRRRNKAARAARKANR